MPIHEATTDDQIRSCFPVMSQLRPHLRADEFVTRIRRQMQTGYRLAVVQHEGKPVAVTGFRLLENLAWGTFLYVDDLVTDSATRSQGHGEQLLTWLIDEAKRLNCDEFHLDSGVQRFAAHRFYLRHRMDITAHHFAMKLE